MFASSLRANLQLVNMAWRYIFYSAVFAGRVTISGVRLSLNSPALSPKMRRNLKIGHYEAHEQQILVSELSSDDRVLELGAGVGFLSILAARKVPSGNIVAVEANAKLITLIEENQKLNGVSSRLINAVLGKGDGKSDFYVAKNFWASSIEPIEGAEKVKVPQRDFQSVLDELKPTFLIVDIEGGGEGSLFSGIRLASIQKCLLELHPLVLSTEKVSQIFGVMAENNLYPDLRKSSGFVYFFARP